MLTQIAYSDLNEAESGEKLMSLTEYALTGETEIPGLCDDVMGILVRGRPKVMVCR